MLSNNRRVPPLVKQAAVPQHTLEVCRRRLRPDGGAPQMVVRPESLIAAGRDLPTRLPDPIRQVRLVPFGRPERFVERPPAIEAGAPDDPRPNHAVHILQPEP